VTGLYQGITEPAALRTLLRAQVQSGGKLAVRLSSEPKLHRKLYLVRNGSRLAVFTGSSNLTQEGLTSSGELMLSLEGSSESGPLRSLLRDFEESWRNDTVLLTRERIERYESLRPNRRPPTLSRSAIRSILGRKEKPRSTKESHPKTFWRDYIEGWASSGTMDVIAAETDWDRRNLDCRRPEGSERRIC
jgi:hypothetical protein